MRFSDTLRRKLLRYALLPLALLVSGMGFSDASAQTLCYYNDQPETDPANCPDPTWSYANDFDTYAEDCVLAGPRPAPSGMGGLIPPGQPNPDVIQSGSYQGERCDIYAYDRYERPLSQDGVVYYPEYDIVQTAIGENGAWFYYAIRMYGVNQNDNLDGEYGYEIDFDGDNRGDFYVNVKNPTFDQIKQFWTQKDVLMYEDTNNDVGANLATVAEGENNPKPTTDGYDREAFKMGGGAIGGPDVYARVRPDSINIVEIAIRIAFVGNPAAAGNLRGWATKGSQDRNLFYRHDEYTYSAQGGAYTDEPRSSNFYEGDNSHGIGQGHLPVELTAFDVQLNGQEALLTWETASETNNAGFFVETDAGLSGSFNQLAFVEGHGTTEFGQAYSYRVEALAPGRHVFRLKQIDFDGTFEYHPEVEVVVEMVERFLIEPVYPNPFNPQAKFRFAVQRSQPMRVELYDMLGRQVKVLYAGVASAGQMQVVLIDGGDLPSGMYVVRVTGASFVKTQTVTLIR